MVSHEEIRQLINKNTDIAEFADFGDGTSSEMILNAELTLGFKLPKSYKWWLRNYSGGEIGGEEIFSIYGVEDIASGDVVQMYQMRQPSDGRIPICHSDIDGLFCFDPSLPAEKDEYAVLSEGTGRVYAKDFLEFLKIRIELYLE